jgi:Zn-dependent M28 family amino/carboxypeptidase
MNTEKITDPEYTDENYYLEAAPGPQLIPWFTLGSEASQQILNETGYTYSEIEEKLDGKHHFYQELLREKKGKFSIEIKTEPLLVRNVIGIIPGKDTTKSIVIGAHYDHLGKRGNEIYNGSDDNASGVAGILALAGHWRKKNEQPAFNLVFAAWTAEEKGLLGSKYFVKNNSVTAENTLLYINFDMISRSAPDDSTGLQLSIGTLKEGMELRNMATQINQELPSPFELDLWEASENGGSDYAYFASEKIPIMTFFSGYQEDYHTIKDTSPKADLIKMASIIKLSNQCLEKYIDSISKD